MKNEQNENQDFEQESFENNSENRKNEIVLRPMIPPFKAGILGLVGAFVFYQIIGGFLTLSIFGTDPASTNLTALRLMQIVAQFLFIFLPAVVFAKYIYEDVSTVLRISMPDWKELALFLLGVVLLTPILHNYLSLQEFALNHLAAGSEFWAGVKDFFDSVNEMQEEMFSGLLKVDNFFDIILIFIVVTITPALCEEAMFRGYIQKSFELQAKPFVAIGLTAVFFALYHFNMYGLIPLIMLGAYFGYAAYKSDSLLIPIILHFLNNLSATIIYFTTEEGGMVTGMPIESIDVMETVWGLLLSIFLFAIVIVVIHRFYENRDSGKSIVVEYD